jgi:hypothetical protein
LAGSCVVEDEAPLGDELLGEELLAPLLGELGLAPLLELLELGEPELAPPEAEPDFALSLEADPLMPEDELEEDGLEGLDVAPPDGDELLGEAGEDVLELEEPDVLLGLSPRSQAARPRARATATAMAESFMCPPWVGINRESSKLRAQPKPLIAKGLSHARGTLFRVDGSSYLLLPLELPGLLGLLGLLGLGEDFLEALELVLPLVPDGLELEPLGEDVAPPEADLLLSRSHPVIRALPRDNASAATNAVNFMLTSVVVCQQKRSKEWTGNPSSRRACSTRIMTAVRNSAKNASRSPRVLGKHACPRCSRPPATSCGRARSGSGANFTAPRSRNGSSS